MGTMTDPQQEFDRHVRDRLTAIIEAQPEVLLEQDGGPIGLKADLYLATLYGFDEQVDAEIRVPKPEWDLRMPIRRRLTLAEPEPMEMVMPVALYVLQSNYATMQVDWLHMREFLPSDVKPPPLDYIVTVALLRYRRRS